MQCFNDPQVEQLPFPHFVAKDWLDADLYRELSNTFPELQSSSGPTGYGLFWGDPQYDLLLSRSAAWRTLFDAFQTDDFVSSIMKLFEPTFRDESIHDLSNAHYITFIEDRQDKENVALRHVGNPPDALYVRVDLLQGRVGYDRRRHLDHRRRAATVLIYFGDAEELAMDGGDLILHGDAGSTVTVRPRANLAAGFVSNNASWHSVSPIRAQLAPRNFVQVTVSSSVDLWSPVPEPSLVSRARSRLWSAFKPA